MNITHKPSPSLTRCSSVVLTYIYKERNKNNNQKEQEEDEKKN